MAGKEITITSRQWLSQTGRFGAFRSKELKAVDEALKTYEAAKSDLKFDKVKQAFAAWKAKAGADWAESERNRAGAVTELEHQLNGTQSKFADDLANAREGVLFLFANTKVKGGWVQTVSDGLISIGNAGAGLDQVSDILGATKLTGVNVAGDLAQRGVKTMSKAVTSPRETLAKIKAFLMNLGRNVLDSIIDKFRTIRSAPLEAADGLLSIVESSVKITLTNLLPKIAPFVASGIDLGEGLKKMGVEIYRRYKVYEAGVGVRLQTGHPAVMFGQIQNAMNVSIGKGLYQALKGGGLLAADLVTFGSSALAGLIISGAEMLIKLIWRIVEMTRMNKFFALCQPKWNEVKASRQGNKTTDFVADAPGFAEWYEGASLAMPCLSMIALKSGLVGDKMRMLKMFTGADEKNVISQAKFDQGVTYIDRLKEWGQNYIEESGFKFYSSDGTINALLGRKV